MSIASSQRVNHRYKAFDEKELESLSEKDRAASSQVMADNYKGLEGLKTKMVGFIKKY